MDFQIKLPLAAPPSWYVAKSFENTLNENESKSELSRGVMCMKIAKISEGEETPIG